jgi:1-deoxy-D-xylulose 5-phosphate reductoisomerase
LKNNRNHPIFLNFNHFVMPIAHSAGETPVTRWLNQDEAFLAIAQGIRKAVEELQQHKSCQSAAQLGQTS